MHLAISIVIIWLNGTFHCIWSSTQILSLFYISLSKWLLECATIVANSFEAIVAAAVMLSSFFITVFIVDVAYRLRRHEEWRNTGLGDLKLEFLQQYHFTLKQDRIFKKYQLVKQYKVLIPTREDWCMPDKITNPNVDIWFLDSTGINICFGAGVYEPVHKQRASIPMGSFSALFQAEVMAFLRCTDLFMSKNKKRRRVHFSSGCRIVIAALAEPPLSQLWYGSICKH